MTKRTIQQRLRQKTPVLLDGAMGTEILNRGHDTKLPLWSAEVLMDHPEVVQQIHEDYIAAGAEIVVTNTFSTTEWVLDKKGLGKQARDLTLLACRLAHQARNAARADHEVYIAGSIAPLEDCYSPELTPSQTVLEREHAKLAGDLKDGGVDFILLETHITIRETVAAARAAKAVGLPIAVCFCCNEKGELLSGESLGEALRAIEDFKPLFVGVNCVPITVATKVLFLLKQLTTLPVAVYAQADGGPDDDQGWKFAAATSVKERYVVAAREWLKSGAQVIGSCCGSTPVYTTKLKELIAE
ncbi:MAG TPA: homocysteine S-methyltransferase family protein [Candidatus Saccharimonadales bacterium]|nr:homocysteine S-methyltransferase family protein [Candidatus Saccharimonadales bacterium]